MVWTWQTWATASTWAGLSSSVTQGGGGGDAEVMEETVAPIGVKSASASDMSATHTFFKVVSHNPSGLKTGRQDGGPALTSDDMVICPLDVVMVDKAARAVYLRVRPGEDETTLLCGEVLSQHLTTLTKWQVDSTDAYVVPGVQHVPVGVISKTMSALLDVQAMEDVGGRTLAIAREGSEHLPALQELERLGVTVCSSRSDATSDWQLASLAEEIMLPATRILQPAPYFQARADLDSKRMTAFDMYDTLKSRGWELRVWRDREPAPAPINVRTQEPKVLFMKYERATMSKPYLQA